MTPEATRSCILTSIPGTVAQFERPEAKLVHIPKNHLKALDLDSMLVTGMRGAGKSFWWHSLQDPTLRAEALGRSAANALKITAGWSAGDAAEYPNAAVFEKLRQTFSAEVIWQTVIVSQVAVIDEIARGTWQDKVAWVAEHPEDVADAMRAANSSLRQSGLRHLVLFDELDRTAGSREERLKILAGLLQRVLGLRSTSSIRAKVFVRPDMIERPEVRSFPDASKLLASAVELRWPRIELYALLWQHLGNASKGAEEFRAASGARSGASWSQDGGVWRAPELMRVDEDTQRKVLEIIASPYMGKDRRRGITYDWLPNHLADGRQQVSPRSFLLAIRHAAEQPPEADSEGRVHWRAIQAGVIKASETRVGEISEDQPWAELAMKALKGQSVPMDRDDVVSVWRESRVLTKLKELEPMARPPSLSDGLDGLITDLIEIGILQQSPDGRINTPDVCRIHFGLGRKGGIKPVN